MDKMRNGTEGDLEVASQIQKSFVEAIISALESIFKDNIIV